MGIPKFSKIRHNPQKSSPRRLLGRYLVQPPKKQQKLMTLGYPETLNSNVNIAEEKHQTALFPPDSKNLSKTRPKGSLVGTCWAPWAAKRHFWAAWGGVSK